MEEHKTNETKDLVFIATYSIPLGIVAGFLIKMMFGL